MTNKRKGSNVLVSTISSPSTRVHREWELHREDLKVLQVKGAHRKLEDLLKLVQPKRSADGVELQESFRDETQRLATESKTIQERLLKCIDKEQRVLSTETDNVYLLEKEVSELSTKTADLQQDLDELQPLTLRTKDRIYESKQYLEQEHEEVELVQQKHLIQVPRLKEQISMYATTTGIKWDYDSETLLEGTMAIPDQKTFVRFSIDPTDLTPFAVANDLWDKMEGRPEKHGGD